MMAEGKEGKGRLYRITRAGLRVHRFPLPLPLSMHSCSMKYVVASDFTLQGAQQKVETQKIDSAKVSKRLQNVSAT